MRFPLALQVSYRSLFPEGMAGAGETVNFSSSAVLFTVERELPVGMSLELIVRWPALLERSIPLQVSLFGTTVRATGDRAVLKIDKHEFRTARLKNSGADSQ